jgi:hypothetical protein
VEVVDPATLAGRVEGGAMASPAVTKASVIALPPHAEVCYAFPVMCADILSGTLGAPSPWRERSHFCMQVHNCRCGATLRLVP